MRRRDFIASIGGAATLAIILPRLARAQSSTKRPLIAVLSAVRREDNAPLNALMEGMRELGYVEGRNVDIAFRFADGHHDRFPALAEEAIRLSPDVIVALVIQATVALLANPIERGLIASMSRPGGNVTGVMFRIDDLAGKQLEIAAQLVPALAKVGLIVNVATDVIVDRQEAERAAGRLGIKLVPAEVRGRDDLAKAFQVLSNEHVKAVVLLVDGMLFVERKRIAELAAAARLPAVYGFRDHVDVGGLISYGVNLAENFRRSASYVDKIIKGAKPGDLPVEFPNKLEMIINLKTAKTLGLDVPAVLLARADEVIE
jgi:putative tryptophan/tyrosine transport system substrate-binding protein